VELDGLTVVTSPTRRPVALPAAVATAGLVLASLLAACSADPAASAPSPTPTDTGTVLLPTSAVPTTDSSGHVVEALPTGLPEAPLTDTRIRGMDYSYPVPVGWTQGQRDLDPPPDTAVQPEDDDVPAFIAVEQPFEVGPRRIGEVVDKLRAGFAAKGLRPKAAPERDVAGYHAQGIVVDQSEDVRHVYYVVVYTEKAFAIRLTCDPHEPSALAVYDAVLDAWSWG
jgi:hypothetical protein